MDTVRPDLIEKVTGRAEYITDLTVPGMLHGFVVRSPAIHARIVSIDTSAARSMDGVVDVLIGEDVASFGCWGVVLKDRPIIAVDRVRYVGEPVAIVIAETIEIAENAAELVDVVYEELPRATTILEAMAEGAPLIHEHHENLQDFYFKGGAKPTQGSNVFHTYRNNVGDVDAAEAAAAYVHEDHFTFPAISHFAMEPHTVIADFKGDSLTVWAGAQTPVSPVHGPHTSQSGKLQNSPSPQSLSARQVRGWHAQVGQPSASSTGSQSEALPSAGAQASWGQAAASQWSKLWIHPSAA